MVESLITRGPAAPRGVDAAFIYFPLILIVRLRLQHATSRVVADRRSAPTKWFCGRVDDEAIREALRLSILAGLAPRAIALFLGTLASSRSPAPGSSAARRSRSSSSCRSRCPAS